MTRKVYTFISIRLKQRES